LGDAVYELHIRQQLLQRPCSVHQLHQKTVQRVRAEAQAVLVEPLRSYLHPSEQEILKRGHNANSTVPQRLDPETYRKATALEALLGYLYLSDPGRLEQVLAFLDQLSSDEIPPSISKNSE
jgi:ribonuclease III family protein